ncbi:MAG: phosphoenolpyruvate-utilizing protein [Acidobacteria bacterium]|nr:phosphoenolpyruvate-utilizing protein [Acidobacteriota bacterium]
MDRWIADTDPGVKFPAWTRGNAADVFPDPASPFFATTYLRTALGKGLVDAYSTIGVFDWDEVENPIDPTMFGVFGGYIYNPLSYTRLFGARMPGASPEAIDKAFFDERDEVPAYHAEPWHESARHAEKLGATAGWVLTTESYPQIEADKVMADTARATRPDFSTLDNFELMNRARSMVPLLRQAMMTGMISSTLSSIGTGVVGAITEALGDPSMSVRLLAGIEADSAEPPRAIWRLSRLVRASKEIGAEFDRGVVGLTERLRASSSADTKGFVAALDDFLFHYGSRGPAEWDVIALSWEARPDVALATVDRMRLMSDADDPAARRAEAVAERDRVLADVRAKLAGDAETLGTFEAGMRASTLFLSARERYKANCIKLVGEIREPMREIARRMVAQGLLGEIEHIFMLMADEVDEFGIHPERYTKKLAERHAAYRTLFDVEPPFAVDGKVAPISQWKKRTAAQVDVAKSGDVLKGVAASSGVATGTARVILDPAQLDDFEPGDVLIAPQTDPSWAPLFLAASAVVVNVGAVGSHAMIASRELGIPCVPSVENATARIPSGVTVTVDGNAGTVTIH